MVVIRHAYNMVGEVVMTFFQTTYFTNIKISKYYVLDEDPGTRI